MPDSLPAPPPSAGSPDSWRDGAGADDDAGACFNQGALVLDIAAGNEAAVASVAAGAAGAAKAPRAGPAGSDQVAAPVKLMAVAAVAALAACFPNAG